MILQVVEHVGLKWAIIGLDIASAFFGALGSYCAARKYARSFWSGLVFAVISAGFWIFRQGEKVKEIYSKKVRANEDIPDAPSDMAVGLNMILLAFIAQLVKIVLGIIMEKL